MRALRLRPVSLAVSILALWLTLSPSPAAQSPATAPARDAASSGDALQVLFIGNSFTYVNNVPRLIEAIAASLPGPCIETAMIASGGAPSSLQ